jgi:hypothetical protein
MSKMHKTPRKSLHGDRMCGVGKTLRRIDVYIHSLPRLEPDWELRTQ